MTENSARGFGYASLFPLPPLFFAFLVHFLLFLPQTYVKPVEGWGTQVVALSPGWGHSWAGCLASAPPLLPSHIILKQILHGIIVLSINILQYVHKQGSLFHNTTGTPKK